MVELEVKVKPSEDALPIGTLPSQYKRMSSSRKEPPSNRLYLLIPMLICGSLLWFAYSQWHNPPQVQRQPARVADPTVKKRVWWMPDLLKTLPPFADGYRSEKFVEKYNLTSCSINGNFPELNSAIFCYLQDTPKFAQSNTTISEQFKTGAELCGGSPPHTLASWDQWKEYLVKPVRRLAFIQDPLERFARQYHKICEIENKCYDCKGNMACFMRRMLKEHQKLAEGLQDSGRSYQTNHFSPQTWNCHFHNDFHNVRTLKIGGNETQKAEFVRNLSTVLSEQKIPSDILKKIEEEVMKIPLELGKEELKIMESVRKDEDLRRLFRYLYEHDFIVFGYKL